MKLCNQCHSILWPYAIAIFIAGVTAFLTWLFLGYIEFDTAEQIMGAIGAFLAVGATLSHYMVACMEQRCQHEHKLKKGQQKLRIPSRPVGV